MGGVAPGSPVSAGNTNPAFIDANGDDAGIGKYNWQNTDPASGPFTINHQREINSLNSFSGRTIGSIYNALPGWVDVNAGTSVDTLFARAEALTVKMNPTSGGHEHDDTVGNGPKISATNLKNVNLQAFAQQGTDLTGVTGGSTDVSTELTGKTPSTAPTLIGVVVNAPYNKVILTYASGANEGDKITDGSGNIVYGRLTESTGVWTLTYYTSPAGVETPYTFVLGTDVRWYYQEIFNPLDGVNVPPVYSSLFFTPSDNATADVVDATPSIRGLVNTGTQSFGGNKTFTGNVIIQGLTTLATGLTGVVRATAGVISTGLVALATEVSGILGITNGGTGANNRTDALDNIAPATPAKGDLLVYNSVTGHWVRFPAGANGDTVVYDSTLDTGIKTGPGISYRAGNEALSIGASNHTFTFSSAMPNTNYRVSVSFVNTTDTFPAFIPYTVIAKTTTTFEISWNSQLDSANYTGDYFVTGDN